jgi:GGDEF domain-containing protein
MATSPSTRSRRFALPDLKDERADEVIEAYLDGPEVRRQRPSAKRPRRPRVVQGGSSGTRADATSTALVPVSEIRRAVAVVRPPTDLRTIPGRLEFGAALERESVRADRYNRPAAVAIVELRAESGNPAAGPWLKSLAGPIVALVRGGSRATDLVARVAESRFQVLLPETGETGAGHFAERIADACRTTIDASGAPVVVRVSVAAASEDHSLQDALAEAVRSIEAA